MARTPTSRRRAGLETDLFANRGDIGLREGATDQPARHNLRDSNRYRFAQMAGGGTVKGRYHLVAIISALDGQTLIRIGVVCRSNAGKLKLMAGDFWFSDKERADAEAVACPIAAPGLCLEPGGRLWG